jgi:hypothetical protein
MWNTKQHGVYLRRLMVDPVDLDTKLLATCALGVYRLTFACLVSLNSPRSVTKQANVAEAIAKAGTKSG